jgi:S1-C subfamily serine protease
MTNGSVAEGSGFVYNFTGGGISVVIVITNNHVVAGASVVSVTFSNGNGYAASINGTDNYSDLAVLIVHAPESEFRPLNITSSSTLNVGNPVIAIGNPFGLVGSMTTGIVSALGRTISEGTQGGFAIANIIQTSAPINPGNSGGPLLNYMGEVVGITTAIIQDSQGLGFAVPSNTILREVYSLITTRGYSGHSYLGITGSDMDYETAQEMHVNATYGWLIASVVSGGPAADAGVRADDIVVGMNGTDIRNGDELSSYLEEHTFPADVLVLRIIRWNDILNIPVVLDRRP